MHEEPDLSNKYPRQIQIGQRAMEGRKADAWRRKCSDRVYRIWYSTPSMFTRGPSV